MAKLKPPSTPAASTTFYWLTEARGEASASATIRVANAEGFKTAHHAELDAPFASLQHRLFRDELWR